MGKRSCVPKNLLAIPTPPLLALDVPTASNTTGRSLLLAPLCRKGKGSA
jgi:hypothetical protein